MHLFSSIFEVISTSRFQLAVLVLWNKVAKICVTPQLSLYKKFLEYQLRLLRSYVEAGCWSFGVEMLLAISLKEKAFVVVGQGYDLGVTIVEADLAEES